MRRRETKLWREKVGGDFFAGGISNLTGKANAPDSKYESSKHVIRFYPPVFVSGVTGVPDCAQLVSPLFVSSKPQKVFFITLYKMTSPAGKLDERRRRKLPIHKNNLERK